MRKINILLTHIPPGLAFPIILTLSFLLALYTVNKGEEIVTSAKESPAFNIEKRPDVKKP